MEGEALAQQRRGAARGASEAEQREKVRIAARAAERGLQLGRRMRDLAAGWRREADEGGHKRRHGGGDAATATVSHTVMVVEAIRARVRGDRMQGVT